MSLASPDCQNSLRQPSAISMALDRTQNYFMATATELNLVPFQLKQQNTLNTWLFQVAAFILFCSPKLL